MKHRLVMAAFLLGILLVGALLGRADADETTRPGAAALRSSLGKSGFEACGLHKLTDLELEQLTMMLIARPAASYLETSATRFLEQNDWRPVTVLGRHELRQTGSPSTAVLVMDNYDLRLLKPWSQMDMLPSPGIYWAQSDLSSWRLLLPDGTGMDFRSLDVD